MLRIVKLLGLLACLGAAGCGSCGQGSYVTEEPLDAGPRVLSIPRNHDGGKPIRIYSLPVIDGDASGPP